MNGPTPEFPPWRQPEQPLAGGYPPHPVSYPLTWPQPYSGWYPPRVPRNDVGSASLLLGIFAAVFFWLPVVDLILGITATWTGFAGLSRIKRGEADNHGAAITGIVLGILVSVASILVIAFVAFIVDYQNCIDHAQGRGEYAQC